MTESVQAALVVAVAPTLAVVVTHVLGQRQGDKRRRALEEHHIVSKQKLEVIHEAVNGRMTEALDKIAKLERTVRGLNRRSLRKRRRSR